MHRPEATSPPHDTYGLAVGFGLVSGWFVVGSGLASGWFLVGLRLVSGCFLVGSGLASCWFLVGLRLACGWLLVGLWLDPRVTSGSQHTGCLIEPPCWGSLG